MPTARLIFGDQDHELANRVTTLGRTTDNEISFPEDSNVSRYHAEIELRFGDYWLIDLESSNGTSVNGGQIRGEVLLKEGDSVILGGSSELTFTPKASEPPAADAASDDLPDTGASNTSEPEPGETVPDDTPDSEEPKKTSNLTMMFGAAGLLFGLAIVCVFGAVLLSPQCGISASACEAKAFITKPETGDTVARTVDIELETENDDCAASAVFSIDGKEIAVVTEKPFAAKLDPSYFANLSDGFEHSLLVVLFDEDGNEISRSGEVALVFETQEIAEIEPDGTPDDGPIIIDPKPSETPGGSTPSVIETQKMAENVLKQFSGNSSYKFDPQFLTEVQKKTSEYTSEGYFNRAALYKDVINEAFVKEQNLDPALGYFLAMSRTGFNLESNAAGEGLWRMPNEFVTSNGYNQLCIENQSLSDPSQNCATKAASLYLKGLVIGVFEGDVVYSIAAFGKSQQAANIWKSTLPADRTDFWNVIKSPKEREQIVRFFAAGIVAENPQKFGLKNDRPISELYSFMLRK